METEAERALRIAIQTGLVVALIALKPIWMKWLYKIGYRDWRNPEKNPYEDINKPRQ